MLECAVQICERIALQRVSVRLLHADDRDMGGIVAALVQLMLDPYYRTVIGFHVLLQKELVAMGHPFAQRSGGIGVAAPENGREDKEAPLFMLFLDCVHQLQVQFVSSFQFGSEYLIYLSDQSTSNLFGTFLFDCDKTRAARRLDKLCASFWEHVERMPEAEWLRHFNNPWYDPQDEARHAITSVGRYYRMGESSTAGSGSDLVLLRPETALPALRLWSAYRFRWSGGSARRQDGDMSLSRAIRQLQSEVTLLHDARRKLQRSLGRS